ncbi:tetratricopeptide repeat protein [Tuwongella immobilis]|uniref:Uncharacterized protein n=1 Tax=Tuwongella immobilis TaxID=692036 RepID=A0A6C2YKC8_9BACT|nr:tetratricopeptide repeat protein [Tuwongella immobilis]VIP01837.1 tetratricopeptide tpr_1 repeat-containing protein : TPR repeat-containing proptein OS=Anabaena sp. 90 GN=ANA_C10959 PE=4 SV=1: TPR_11 [Tuwongella immobilis]VTR99599.1 tetratricopeptide tpr_1 repeat-containing protein : TPR repeat-containing proptein OS=Anabaena sp. 90 GN=ANA_C10959 PE=4 SV=1: TPR_11 [Tuwongella immobilis]
MMRRAGWRTLGILGILGILSIAGVLLWQSQPVTRSVPPIEIPLPPLEHLPADLRIPTEQAADRVRQTPTSAEAWGALGMRLRADDWEPQCIAAFAQAERLNPTDLRWPYLLGLTRLLQHPEMGLADLKRAAELATADRPQPLERTVELLLERGEFQLAESLLAKHPLPVARSPRRAWLQARLAADRDDWPAALAACELAWDAPAAQRKARLLAADALDRQGQSSRAEQLRQEAAQLPPDSPWDDPIVAKVEQLGRSIDRDLAGIADQLAANDTRRAIAQLRQFPPNHPQAETATRMLAQVHAKQGDLAEADAVLQRWLSDHPRAVEVWFQRGVVAFQRGDFAGADAAFERVLSLKPDHALAAFNRGHTQKRLGNLTAARDAFQASLQIRPDYAAARDALEQLPSTSQSKP